ncbi:MAG: hypothetical protein BTN85_0308 [Candidatus Methanohalarchaeum thermophilum]|uniref:Uncharacterized protein n=1 Tax=Methanohalarchaeum thermophilum TaxID=1903181 RepID=A0A1Q6DU08_METT1|nr:MAG: hypothetical protein BTN85_0308 [Candidatus Methanohalarchaeum thermophilum]
MQKFSRAGLAAIIGLMIFFVVSILFILYYPTLTALIKLLIPWLTGIALLIVSFIFFWSILYAFTIFGVAVYYFIKNPTEVSKTGYSINSTEEKGEKQTSKNQKKKRK